MKKSRIITLYIIIVVFSFFFNFYFRPIKGNPLVDDKYKNSKAYINSIYKSDEYFKEKLLKKKDYEIYYAIIQGSLNDDIDVTINCKNKCGNFSNAYEAVLLDHPELISLQGSNGYYDYGDKITYKNYNNLNQLTTFFGTKRIEREMENIRRDTKNMSDKEKIIFVYDYVSSHDYDHIFMYNKSNQSAYSFFSFFGKGKTVCAGFAKTSQMIFQNIGIKSYLVHGFDHMWNYVEYEGKYYVFDATYGASFTDKGYKLHYDGLGKTTVNEIIGNHKELYPEIEKTPLKKLFNLK